MYLLPQRSDLDRLAGLAEAPAFSHAPAATMWCQDSSQLLQSIGEAGVSGRTGVDRISAHLAPSLGLTQLCCDKAGLARSWTNW